ncbi:hypothetical protein [Lentzea californiensis]|uniref:hypothetical protein n=1 Tax=Lentzea californiensis TaxID=438851 RepID=UPI0021665F9E|nr:hypothetical protein [Lentzea californiensis]MCR3749669.1 hypothetical protein [Lentzea californiensis]
MIVKVAAALVPNTIRDLAGALDRDRVVTLRFDKYGTGCTGLGAWAGRPQDIDYPAFVRHAATARRALPVAGGTGPPVRDDGRRGLPARRRTRLLRMPVLLTCGELDPQVS